MGALPRALVLLSVCATVFSATLLAVAAEEHAAAPMVVGLAKCADCTRKNMKAETTFKGLRVAVKCKNGNGEYETKATGEIANSGAFIVPLNGDLHSSDDCIAQLHTAANSPCPGQEPSKIVHYSSGTFVAVAGKTHYPSAVCSSAFLCDPFHKKDFFFHHYNNKPSPVPSYKPPSSTPVYKNPTPVPAYKNPTPVYSHPAAPSTPIYHPPAAEEKKVKDAEVDPELFKKLLPLIKKKPFLFPKLPKFPPMDEDAKP